MSDRLTQNPSEHIEDARTGSSVETLKRGILDNLFYVVGRAAEHAGSTDFYMALACTVRDRILARFMHTIHSYKESAVRAVSYLSAEFLMGPQLLQYQDSTSPVTAFTRTWPIRFLVPGRFRVARVILTFEIQQQWRRSPPCRSNRPRLLGATTYHDSIRGVGGAAGRGMRIPRYVSGTVYEFENGRNELVKA